MGRLLGDEAPPQPAAVRAFDELLSYVDNVARKPPPVQMGIGGAVGL